MGFRGPCDEKEFFVLDKNLDEDRLPQGNCKPNPCWNLGDNGFVQMENGECKLIGTTPPICNDGMEVKMSPFGEGIPDFLL